MKIKVELGKDGHTKEVYGQALAIYVVEQL